MLDAHIDHVVLWVADPLRSLDFYTRVVGLPTVRAEFRTGKVPFPSVRVSNESILDLMAAALAPSVGELTRSQGSAGHPVNHVCLAVGRDEFAALRGRLAEAGVASSALTPQSFGGQGLAAQAFYFSDPDGNVVEARYYA